MTDRQFREVKAGVEHTVARFISDIRRLEARWDSVGPSYVVEITLLELCDKLAKFLDDPELMDGLVGPAEVKLSNALADYRDTRWEDRGGPLVPPRIVAEVAEEAEITLGLYRYYAERKKSPMGRFAMKRQLRPRFWVTFSFATMTGLACVITLIWPDWIEMISR